jgi:N-acetylmuramoyl-L-alanine amidase
MKNKYVLLALFIALIPFTLFPLSLNVRSFDHPGYTRIVFEGDRGFEYHVDQSKTGLEIKLDEKAELEKQITTFKRSVLVDKVVHHLDNNKSVLRVHLKSSYKVTRNFVLERPFRVVFDLVKSEEKEEAPPVAEDKPGEQQEDIDNKSQENQLLPKKRVLIETICLDPGHGGSDLGAVGNNTKIAEKDITLKVAGKLRQRILNKLGLNVVMTREKDAEVSLNSRVSIANNRKAQIFISIHVNSSFRKSARGSETFYVSLKATDQEAFQLSQKENRAFAELDEMTEDDELKMILWDMAQNQYIKESSKLAEFIQDELNILLHTRNRGVKQAPFRVLMRAAMPAVLVEIVFLSNPYEERRLQDDAFLDDVTDALYKGISEYIQFHNNAYGYGYTGTRQGQ